MVPQIMDGMNVSDYVDPDIKLKLRELEEEEAQQLSDMEVADTLGPPFSHIRSHAVLRGDLDSGSASSMASLFSSSLFLSSLIFSLVGAYPSLDLLRPLFLSTGPILPRSRALNTDSGMHTSLSTPSSLRDR